jgi:hypothetical protein
MYQRRLEKKELGHQACESRHWEDEQRKVRENWDCNFLRFYWNTGMGRLPTIDDCSECNKGPYQLKRKPSIFQRLQQPAQPEDVQACDHLQDDTHQWYDPYHLPH